MPFVNLVRYFVAYKSKENDTCDHKSCFKNNCFLKIYQVRMRGSSPSPSLHTLFPLPLLISMYRWFLFPLRLHILPFPFWRVIFRSLFFLEGPLPFTPSPSLPLGGSHFSSRARCFSPFPSSRWFLVALVTLSLSPTTVPSETNHVTIILKQNFKNSFKRIFVIKWTVVFYSVTPNESPFVIYY